MITLTNVTKLYGEKPAVLDLSLNIEDGQTCVLLGKSGCGKSTTLRMINRLIAPTSGSICIGGKNISDYPAEELRRGIGYVVQGIGLFPYMTVEKNIAVVPQLLKWPKERIRSRVEELLELVGLDTRSYIHKYPAELSGGEAQRVGVARALAADPPIILMDEPFGAVDPINRMKLQNEFLKIQKQLHKTIVFVTHDIEEAVRMGDKIAVMEQGVLQNYDLPERIVAGPHQQFIQEFLGADYVLKLLARFPVSDYLLPAEGRAAAAVPLSSTLQKALSLMISESLERLDVVDEQGQVAGQLALAEITKIMRQGGMQNE